MRDCQILNASTPRCFRHVVALCSSSSVESTHPRHVEDYSPAGIQIRHLTCHSLVPRNSNAFALNTAITGLERVLYHDQCHIHVTSHQTRPTTSPRNTPENQHLRKLCCGSRIRKIHNARLTVAKLCRPIIAYVTQVSEENFPVTCHKRNSWFAAAPKAHQYINEYRSLCPDY